MLQCLCVQEMLKYIDEGDVIHPDVKVCIQYLENRYYYIQYLYFLLQHMPYYVICVVVGHHTNFSL